MTTGIELIDGDCCGWVGTIGAAVKACGGNHSILHTSGVGKWQIQTQHLSTADNTKYLPITVTDGAPMMLSPYAAKAGPPSVAAAGETFHKQTSVNIVCVHTCCTVLGFVCEMSQTC